MKDQRKTEIKVGAIVILGVIVFIWILGWAKNFQLTSSEVEVKVMFTNVSGLEIGNDVTVNGVKKGFVKDYYINQNHVIVVISLKNDIELRRDAKFSLDMTDLMGGKKIEISPGTSNEPADLTAIRVGQFQPDLAGMMSAFGGMENDFRIILSDVKKSLTAINGYLMDENISTDLRSTLANLSDASAKLNSLITRNQDDMRIIIENTKEITSETKELISVNKEGINNSISQLNTVLKKSDSLFTKFNLFADETMSGKNNIGQLLYDDSLLVNMRETLQQVNELTKVILYQITTDGFRVDADIF